MKRQQRLIGVVDDEPAVRESICALVGIENFGSRSYGSAEELLEDAGAADFDCLIVDVRLPGMSGVDLVRQLANENRASPCIVISGHGDDSSIAALSDLEQVWFLEKPHDPLRLLECLQAACGGE